MGKLEYPGPTLQAVTRLTFDSRSDLPHEWAADNQTVYFESDRSGAFHLYRQRLDRRNPEMLTSGEGDEILPQLMQGGRVLLFEGRPQRQGSRGIYRANPDGSDITLVRTEGPLDEWRCPVLAAISEEKTCVVRETDGAGQFVFYTFDPNKGKGKELASARWMPTVFWDWTLSPDGNLAALPDHDANNPAIRLISLGAC